MACGWLFRALAALLLLGAPLPAAAQDEESGALFAVEPLSEGELAQHRGGFRLPNGMEVSLAVTMLTSLNGQPVLGTSFQLNGTAVSFDAQGPDGLTIRTDSGTVTTIAALPDLLVEHLVGNRLGSLIANSGDNRVIDHRVSIDLTLDNVQPLSIGSTMFRVQALGMDAVGLRASGG